MYLYLATYTTMKIKENNLKLFVKLNITQIESISLPLRITRPKHTVVESLLTCEYVHKHPTHIFK